MKQRYLGTMQLILTDDSNVDHSYEIPNCIYDPNSPVNMIEIPVLEKYFNNAEEGPDAVAEDDGSTILSSGCRSHFKWDHGKHSLHFNHPDSQLPELCLYQGTGYFSAFCSRLQSAYDNNVHFAFSSVYSLDPASAVLSDDESFKDSYSENNEGWFSPMWTPPSAEKNQAIDHPSQYFELGKSLSYDT